MHPASFGDRFEVVRRIGTGGMGVVYEAVDRDRSTSVALKTLRSIDPSSVFHFKQEFRSLAGIAHPNLVTLYELVSAGDSMFFTMELVDGGVGFLDYVRPEGQQLDEHRLRGALAQLVRGVAAIHAAGKLHRDLKPSNVLVDRDGRVAICDFGLVANARPRHDDHAFAGTPAYMAPEQAAGDPLTEASDWYGVGVMLYQALTGRLPHTGPPGSMLDARRRGLQPPAPSSLVAHVPPDLEQLCLRLLARDPAERPTAADIARALGDARRDTTGETADIPLVGRAAHLDQLRDAWAAARAGACVVALIHGASGAGKSALLRAFVTELESGGAVVLAGRCFERETVPYKALDGVVDELSSYLDGLAPHEAGAVLPPDPAPLLRLFPVLRRVDAFADASADEPAVLDPLESRRRGFVALRRTLRALARRVPLALAIDDLQWGDRDSAALLAEITRAPAPSLLVLAAARDADVELPPVADTRAIEVGELSIPDAAELAVVAGGRRDRAAAIAYESGGNPFFVCELVRYADLSDADGDAPPRLADLLAARLAELDEPERSLLEIIAVAAHPIDLDIAGRAAGLGHDLAGAIATLRAARLVVSAGAGRAERVVTAHDRIRVAVADTMPPARYVARCRALALELEARRAGEPDELLELWRATGDRKRAGDYAVAGARQAMNALAFDRAAALWRAAIELEPAAPTARECWHALGTALAGAGRGPEAAQAFERAVPGAPPGERLALQRRIAEQLLISGRFDDGIAALESVLAAVGLRMPRSRGGALASLLVGRARLRLARPRPIHDPGRDPGRAPVALLERADACWSASIGLAIVDPVRGADFATRHLLLARRAGDPVRLASSLAAEAGFAATGGTRTLDRTRALVREARALADDTGDPTARGVAMFADGVAEYLAGNWRAARDRLDAAELHLRAQCVGQWWWVGGAQYFALECLYYAGELAELAGRTPALLRAALGRADHHAATNFRQGPAGFVWLMRDEPEEARRHCDEAFALWSQLGYHVQHFSNLFAQGQIDLYEGDGARCLARVDADWPKLARLMLRVELSRIVALHLRARAALAAGDPGRAERDAGKLARERAAWAQPLAALARAGAAALRGRDDDAAALLRDAAAGFDGCDMAAYAAAARARLGDDAGLRELAARGCVRPERVVAMLAPGFREP